MADGLLRRDGGHSDAEFLRLDLCRASDFHLSLSSSSVARRVAQKARKAIEISLA
jgi:hypothetical protein